VHRDNNESDACFVEQLFGEVSNPFFIGWSNQVGEIIDRSSGLRKRLFRRDPHKAGHHKKEEE
jgi:hypothetical protein